MKSGLEIFWKEDFFAKVTNSVTEMTICEHGGISKKMFVVYFMAFSHYLNFIHPNYQIDYCCVVQIL